MPRAGLVRSGPQPPRSSPEPGRADRIAGVVTIGIALLLGLLAAALASVSFASFTSVKAHLDSFASDGDADVTRTEFDAIVVRLRAAAVVAGLAAVAAYARRKRLRNFLGELGASCATATSSLVRGLRRVLAAESPLHLGALLTVIVIAVLVRLEFLFQPMRYDESATFVSYVSPPWYIALTDYSAPNNHVLHSLLTQISTAVFGTEAWAIRLPAFLAGILIVPATYVAARALYDKHAALVGAGLVASSSVLVEYSTNARGYTLVALVFLSMLALATRLHTSWSTAEWLAFALLGAIGFFTVPVMLYAYGTVVGWLAIEVWTRERRLLLRRLLPSVVVTLVLTGLLYAPIIASSGLSALVSNEFVVALPWSTFSAELPDSLMTIGRQWHRDVPLPLALVLGGGFVTAIVFHRRLSRFLLPPAVVALAWIAPVVLAQRVVPFERVWLFLVPLYLLTAAAGILFVLRGFARRVGSREAVAVTIAVAAAGLLAASAVASQAVYRSEETSTFRNGEAIAALLEEQLRPGDKVIASPPGDVILEYLLGTDGLDPAELLYWTKPEDTRRFLVVVKKGATQFSLENLLRNSRLNGIRLGEPRLIRSYDEASVFEVLRVQ